MWQLWGKHQNRLHSHQVSTSSSTCTSICNSSSIFFLLVCWISINNITRIGASISISMLYLHPYFSFSSPFSWSTLAHYTFLHTQVSLFYAVFYTVFVSLCLFHTVLHIMFHTVFHTFFQISMNYLLWIIFLTLFNVLHLVAYFELLHNAEWTYAHTRLSAVLTLAITIDIMKPATIGFIMPGKF